MSFCPSGLSSRPTALASAPGATLASAHSIVQVPVPAVTPRPEDSKRPPCRPRTRSVCPAAPARPCRLPGPEREPVGGSRSTQLPPPVPTCRAPIPEREPPTRLRSTPRSPRPCRLPFPELEPPMRLSSAPRRLPHPPFAQPRARAANAVALGAVTPPLPFAQPRA
ncbi:hypothetical protein PUNSTDRAFT_139486 [Punctularia strigosozonata HHB-11173 SS5]|uniref:Uncharacterized protein n=1 Tax=Punctularia strigosozonata (strain HHB-11173) TaxID=741275 RepID=R7S0W0_PUNST|nr:uncharacterized protein PUNSTDRAFT_139486 [Punctularia strigosozonata HHB-11173 SS5]EIN03489.1 hypothetical protein PUNSTDRAFT_139486 [Punctularia strigosozonata HHB-11173 SS5]